MNAACSGCSSSPAASPSTVVSSAPSCATASARQALARRPSMQDRARAALAVVAALLRPGQPDVLAQQVEQRGADVDVELVLLAVDAER